jgi:hypothetical protein
MRSIPPIAAFVLASLIALPCTAREASAQAGLLNPMMEQIRFWNVHEYHSYDVNADGSYVVTIDQAISPFDAAGIQQAGQRYFPFEEGRSEVEILEAYTLKQDGRRLDVPKESILTTSPPVLLSAPVFSSVKLKAAIFPDVAVGDQVVCRWRLHVKVPHFPGSFSAGEYFPRSVRDGDARISIKYPLDYPLQFDAREISEAGSNEKDGFVFKEWRYHNDQI